MPTKSELLEHAVEILRIGDSLTFDAVARHAGLTKPGVVHHFRTKESMTVAVVDYIVDRWEADLANRTSAESTQVERLRAYVDFAFSGTFDRSDLALIVDPRLQNELTAQWSARLAPWLDSDIGLGDEAEALCLAARLLADGAWFNVSIGLLVLSEAHRTALRDTAFRLIDDAVALAPHAASS